MDVIVSAWSGIWNGSGYIDGTRQPLSLDLIRLGNIKTQDHNLNGNDTVGILDLGLMKKMIKKAGEALTT